MVSVISASRYITPASCYHPRYQSRSSMYIRGLIPQNFAELAEAALIGWHVCPMKTQISLCIHAVLSEYLMGALLVAKGSIFLQAEN